MRPLHLIAMDPRVKVHVVDDDGITGWLLSPIDRLKMKFIASTGFDWDHLSVSCHGRCPVWEEMEHARHVIFLPEETCYQLHVPAETHIDCHPWCLHIWRPQKLEIPRPPGWMVGPEKLAGKKFEKS